MFTKQSFRSAAVLLAMSMTGTAFADTPTALLLTHDMQALAADGVYRTEHFQERFIRDDHTVWVARVIPKGAHNTKEHAAGHEEHKHLDVNAASRLITRDAKGNLSLRLVEHEEHQIVDVPKSEFDAVGFDGHWPTAYYLVDPVRLKDFKRLNQSAPAGSQWYENRNPQSYVRVLWSEQKQYPLQVESGSLDGRMKRTLKVEAQAMPNPLPWQVIKGYQKKDYSDFLD